MEKSKLEASKKRKHEGKEKGKNNKPKGDGNWKKKLKSAIKTQNGFKTVMSVLAEEEASNVEWSRVLTSIVAPTSAPAPGVTPIAASVHAASTAASRAVTFPATTLKLSAILKKATKKG